MNFKKQNKKEDFTKAFVKKILNEMEKNDKVNWLNPVFFEPKASYNALSGKYYRGINSVFLNISSKIDGYSHNAWLTFNQAITIGKKQKLNIHVKKGEHSTPIIFFEYIDRNEETNSILKQEGREDECIYDYKCIIQNYNVFNVEQIEWGGFDYSVYLKPDEIPLKDDILKKKTEEEIIKFFLSDYPNPPKVEHGLTKSGACYYTPTYDTVNVAPLSCFVDENYFISTLAHELVHSTGYKTRLDRLDNSKFGTEPYSKEELVAEIGSSMICSIVGIKERVFDNQVAYLKSWLKALNDNPDWLFYAFSKATKAIEYMGFKIN